jgi:DNA-binding beta-propeller fold protein YncE
VLDTATLVGATALVADASGAPRLFVADLSADKVFAYSVNASGGGSVALFAGRGDIACDGDGGRAPAAALVPHDLSFDSNGALLIVDSDFNAIRVVNMTSQIISSLAVAGLPSCAANQSLSGAAAGATLNQPVAVAFGPNASFIFADFSNAVWRVDVGGALSLLAGSVGKAGFSGDGGPATAAELFIIKGVAFTADGSLLIADRNNHVIRRVDGASGLISTVAGTAGAEGYAGDGGPAAAALLSYPRSLRVAANVGDAYFIDGNNYVVRVIRAASGAIETVAGSGAVGFCGDGGAALAACFRFESLDLLDVSTAGFYGGVGLDEVGARMFIADTGNHAVRVVDLASGRIFAFAGNGTAGHAGDGGLALSALLSSPTAVDVQPSTGCVFIADAGSFVIRSVCAGVIATAAGTASEPGTFLTGFTDGAALGARLGFVTDLVFSADGGALLIADAGNDAVRLLTDASASRPCPAGFACRCGRDLAPCSSPSGWCPANSAAAFPVTPGFAAVGSPSPFAPSQTIYAAQAPCPRGFFCPAGVALPCRAGSYGVAAQQPSADSCLLCKPGSYLADAGRVGASGAASPCAACPAGTLARAAGAAACTLCAPGTHWPRAGGGGQPGDACVACAAGTFSDFGAAACSAAAAADGVISTSAVAGVDGAAVFSFQRLRAVDPGGLPNNRLQRLILITSGPVCAALLLPYCVFVLAFWRCPRARCTALCGRLLRCSDQFSLKSPEKSGQPPVVQRSAVGGALSLFGVGVVAAFAISTLLQFLFANVLLQSSLLPLPVGLLPAYGTLPRRPVAVSVPAAYARLLAAAGGRGFALSLRVWGSRCGTVLATAGDVPFAYSATTDAATLETTHTFACAGCVLTPLSTLAVTFDPSCQAFVATVAAVGVGGGLTVASTSIVAAPGAPLSAATATFGMRLEVVQDRTPLAAISLDDLDFPLTMGISACGYAVASVAGVQAPASPASPAGAAPTAPVVFTLRLPLTADFVLVELSLIMTVIGLLANLAAWLSLLSIGAVVLDLHERLTAHVAGAPLWDLEKMAKRKGGMSQVANQPPAHAVGVVTIARALKVAPHGEVRLAIPSAAAALEQSRRVARAPAPLSLSQPSLRGPGAMKSLAQPSFRVTYAGPGAAATLIRRPSSQAR